jgi:hypothetical protein
MFTLLLKEVPIHAGAQDAALLGDALRAASARCRLYVLADLAAPPGEPVAGAALVEIESVSRCALLVAAGVTAPFRELGTRLIDDLLTELRAEGVRWVGHRVENGDTRVAALLRAAGFAETDRADFCRTASDAHVSCRPASDRPAPGCSWATYDMPGTLWLAREL